jgi:hypothetical protein
MKYADFVKEGSEPVMNIWFLLDHLYSKENAAKFFGLYRNLKTELLRDYGKQDFCTTDSSNRRLYCWQVPLSYSSVWILTAPGRGTSYEVSGLNKGCKLARAELIKFFDDFAGIYGKNYD